MKDFIAGVCALLAILALGAPAQAADWKRADTRHFTIYSDGSTSQLEDFAEDLERFDSLLRMAFGVAEPEHPNRLTIYLLSGADDVARLYGSLGSGIAGFYTPRLEGSIAVSNRQYTASNRLDGQRTLFHEYGHHFMLNNFPVALPAWLVEGFAEFVSTAEFERDGSWTFGLVPQHREYEINNFPQVPIEMLLTERKTKENRNQTQAFYGWSWALTHMLYLGGDGDAAVNEYIRLLNSGTPSLEAAREAFGDLDDLERDLRRYVRGVRGRKSDKPLPFDEGVEITELSDTESELRELVLMRRVGTDQQPLEETRDRLAELAPRAASAEAWYQLARAEFSLAEGGSGDGDETGGESAAEDTPDWTRAQNAAAAALAIDENHVRANVLMGRILVEQADAGTSDDPQLWNRALSYIARANQADPFDPVPLFYFARTELREGRPSDNTNGALARAFSSVRESPEARTAYAWDLARIGQYDEAIGLLEVLANDPHGGQFGRESIERIEEMRDGGGTASIRAMTVDDEQGEDEGADEGDSSGGVAGDDTAG